MSSTGSSARDRQRERGAHRVVLGMAAGVGKSYRALQELRAARDAGRDAVVAYLEPHGRAATVAQAEGLELLPRRSVSHGGVALTELDLAGLVERAPDVALIDELAHTNAPGLEHRKRWEDVEAALDAGIDVISTVNVQHLESLHDLVHDLVGVDIRETVPDHVLTDADEVVLVDLSPTGLLDRLRAGLIYPPDRVETALNNFFRVERLEALRELALRQVADTVEAHRRDDKTRDRATDVSERIVAWIADPATQAAVVRRAWRSAQRLGAPLTVLVTRRPQPPGGDEQAAVDAIARLCSTLGCELVVREGDDPAQIAVAVSSELEATYLLLAPPRRRRFGASVVDRLVEGLPTTDLRLVRDR